MRLVVLFSDYSIFLLGLGLGGAFNRGSRSFMVTEAEGDDSLDGTGNAERVQVQR